MSTVGVVTYSVPMYKSNILQQTNNGNRECKDGSGRKAQHILPQTKDFLKDDMLSSAAAKKKPRNVKEIAKSNPQLVSVARRNARERNRVKQVNNGFANLRERIPNFIASTFESGRGGNKKLSKVETLRMAVEYIRSLEDLLALEENDSENISHSSVTSFQSTTSPPSMSQQNNMTYQYADDDISTNSSPPPQQYVRINTANNTYQIIPAEMYDDSENYEPLDPADHILPDPSLMTTDLDFREVHDMSIIDSRDSLSPGMYSDQSFSPNEIDKIEQKCFVPVFNTRVDTMDNFKLTAIKTEVISEPPLLSLKSESELPEEHINVIQWWEQQPRTTRS